jgi:hypothetical protein
MPPPAEGVGSYAQELGRALAERRGIETVFHAAAVPPPRRRAAALEEALARAEPAAVLLHYANYGYQRRGCPFWLLRALRRWRRGGPGRRLVTVFHEVYATGPPWRSSFWTQPLQKGIAAGTARASDALVTSLDLWVHRIGSAAAPEKTAVTPVFSTVGEPAAVPSLAARAPRLVLFGGRGARGRAYGELGDALSAACRALGVHEIADVGPPLDTPRDEAGGVPVRRFGVLPAAEAGALLLESRAGFVAYPPFFLPKSTIFAAYCAHGVLPVCAWPRPVPDGEVAAGRHYLCPGGDGDFQAIASAARAWYDSHSLSRQTELFHRFLAP